MDKEMNYADAITIGTSILEKVKPACEEGYCVLGGGLRRRKPDVHDIEIVAKPILKTPRPMFGMKLFKTTLDQVLYGMEGSGQIMRISGADKMKKYLVDPSMFAVDSKETIHVEFWLVTPPAQWGVQLVIRTGPGSGDDHFSKWVVTSRSAGGALPDSYRVKHGAVWFSYQLDQKGKPLDGQTPIPMPEEIDFLDFVGLGWIDPEDRHPDWGRFTR